MKYFNKLKIIFLALLVVTFTYVASIAKEIQEVKIVDVEGSLARAEFIELTDKAKKQGLDKVLLEGKIKEINTNSEIGNFGMKTIDINWRKIIDKSTDEVVFLESPLTTSGIRVQPSLEVNDTVMINGDMETLLKDKQKLIKKRKASTSEDEEELEAEKNEEKEGISASNAQGYQPSDSSSSSGDDSEETFNAEIEGEPNIVVTSDGCRVVANIPAMEANQYKRILENGEVIQECSASEEKYALTKDYTACSPLEDLDELKAYQRYNLGYVTEENGARVVVDGGYCNTDYSTAVEINENACGSEIDSLEGKYYKKTSLTYTLNNKSYVAQACVRKEETALNMLKDSSTCKPSFEGGFYTPFFNWYVEEEGKYVGLSECLPNTDEKEELHEEICTGENKYTYDNDNQRAYLNKTFFYNKDDEKITISTCEPSDVIYNYETEIDSSVCPFINNDETHETIQKGYHYFKGYNDERVDIQDRCISILPAVPYVPTGSIWKTTRTETKLVGNEYDLKEYDIQRNTQPYATELWLEDPNDGGDYWNNDLVLPCLPSKYKVTGLNDKKTEDRVCLDLTSNDLYSTKFKRYCLAGMSEPLHIKGTTTAIDLSNSTEQPSYTSQTTKWWKYDYTTPLNLNYDYITTRRDNRNYYFIGNGNVRLEFACGEPKCNVSTLERRPTYERVDGTEYVDEENSFETKYVCGDDNLRDVRVGN